MCGCEFNYVCSRCAGTRHDPRYFIEIDPAEQRDDEGLLIARREAAAVLSAPVRKAA